MVARPGFGTATTPTVQLAVGADAGLWNQARCPRYQMAVQSPCRPARAYVWPAEARAPWSDTSIVFGVPSGRSAMSLTSGASSDGAVCSTTDEEPRGAHGVPGVTQPVNAGWLVA